MATTVSAPGAGAFKPLDDDAKSKVKAQMEFYFSDSNLPRDKFLRETVEADPDGFVDIQLLATFSRMRSLLAAFGGAHNDETIGAVVELLKTSTELTVSDDGKRVRRTAAVRSREEIDAEVEMRSVYASPFPMTATIDALTEFFSKVTKVRSVRLRRHITSKDFKGSIFVELEDDASCKALIDGAKLTFEGAEITIMMKKDYLEKKKIDRVEKAAANAAAAAAAAEKAQEAKEAGGDEACDDAGDDAGDDATAAASFTPGLILKFTLGEGVAEGTRREDLSEALSSHGTIKFIDFKIGDKDGCVRFEDADVVSKIVEKHGGDAKLQIGGANVTLDVMQGDEESSYWKALAQRAGQGGGRGGGRGGRGGGRGRGGRGGGRGGRGKRGSDGGGGGGKRARN